MTPLAIGTGKTWDLLLSGATGTQSLQAAHLPEGHAVPATKLPSQVVAPVDSQALERAKQQLPVRFPLGLSLITTK